MFFGSDNTSPVHPKIMQALAKANEGYVSSYGADPIMEQVRDQVRNLFQAPDAAVFLVATGSAANALALATYCPPWGAVYCHKSSHIEVDECGAPEFYAGGAKLITIDGDHGKMRPEDLRKSLEPLAHGDVHTVQPGIVSITNVTEMGTVYAPDEIAALCAIAKDFGIPCHMDGARFANALQATGATPAKMTWKSGIDILSFGGTKNGLMAVEAVVIFDPAKAWEFELRRKRGGHLFSKHRYLSAQMNAYLQDELWLALAQHSNAMGSKLSKKISALADSTILHPTDANVVFANLPRAVHRKAQDAGAVYSLVPFYASLDGPGGELLPARLVCSWSTTDGDIDQLIDTFKS